MFQSLSGMTHAELQDLIGALGGHKPSLRTIADAVSRRQTATPSTIRAFLVLWAALSTEQRDSFRNIAAPAEPRPPRRS